MDNIIIFGYPRSATKLLADAYVQNGYHNYGEFFDTYTNEVVHASIPYARRTSMHDQKQSQLSREQNRSVDDFKRCLTSMHRLKTYKDNPTQNSTVTVWVETLMYIPDLFSELSNHRFLCTRRKDEFEQLVSRYLTYCFKNYNEEVSSSPVHVNTDLFAHFFFEKKKTDMIQSRLVEKKLGVYVDFDDLIRGQFTHDIQYVVSTRDQHRDLLELVTNLDQIKHVYEKLQKYFQKLVDKH